MNDVKTETRRKAGRAKIGSEIAYLNFDSGNGAIVVDVSAEGLGFQAADRVDQNSPLAFRLCTSELPNIDLAGEVAWLDETRKRGGIRLRVPANSLPPFQRWLRKHFDLSAEAEQMAEMPPNPAAEAEPKYSTPSAAPDPKPAARVPNFSARPPAHPAGRGPIFVSEWEYPPEESHKTRNVLALCVILALGLAIAGSYYFGGRRQVGAALIRLGQSLVGTSPQAPLRTLNATNANALAPAQPNSQLPPAVAPNLPAAPQSSAPTAGTPAALPGAAATNSVDGLGTPANASNTTPAASSAPPPERAQNVAPAVPTPAATPNSTGGAASSAASASTPAAPQAPAFASREKATAPKGSPVSPSAADAPAAFGQSEVAQASKLLQSSNPEDSAVAADLLWSAVSKGNTKAEMMLADIYLEGHGTVRKNCRQAEALLTAAQSANVPGAEAKIEELQTYGCR